MWRLVAAGVAVHLLLLAAVFEIRFMPPLEHGLQKNYAHVQLSKRVVLLVVDGLRAESLFGSEMATQAPYLRGVIQNVGSWGIAHTQVPTDSQSGHVAILAGFNEDPRAIFKVWKSNPVNFDSVINQRANSWCWGNSDILRLFNPVNPWFVTLYSYDANEQNFTGGKSPITWVFREVQQFIKALKRGYCEDVCAHGNLFFLHLSAGHSFKPGSEEFVQNIKIVDEGVKFVEKLFYEYFRDNQTTFIFTSDHGMTDWGTHGDGSPHETEVPFIAWGAAIPISAVQKDIQQIAIAPFISALLGRHIPKNSFGIIPLEYINASVNLKSRLLFANALQLAKQYLRKLNTIDETSVWHRIRCFKKLRKVALSRKLENIEYYIDHGFHTEAIHHSYNVIHLCIEGIYFYNNYNHQLLLPIVILGFMGWMVYLFCIINHLTVPMYFNHCLHRAPRSSQLISSGLFYSLLFGIGAVSYTQNMPIRYYIYFMFPVFTWCAAIKNFKNGSIGIEILDTYSPIDCIVRICILFTGIELLLLTFFDRRYLSALFLILGLGILKYEPASPASKVWSAGQMIMGLGPSLLTLRTEFYIHVHVISLVWWVWYIRGLFLPSRRDRYALHLQMFVLSISFINALFVDLTLNSGSGLLWSNKVLSWILTIMAPLIPLTTSFSRIELRILSTILALLTPYTLMAIGYENLFMFFFAQHMVRWLSSEIRYINLDEYDRLHATGNYVHGGGPFVEQHFIRRCFYLVSFIMLGHFGVGNNSSLNSFNPNWARSFLTVFTPFTTMCLIIFKFMIPFLMVLCTFRVMVKRKEKSYNNLVIIMLLYDIMLLQLIIIIASYTSWLEIGATLPRFVFVSASTIALILCYPISYYLTIRLLPKLRLRFLRHFV